MEKALMYLLVFVGMIVFYFIYLKILRKKAEKGNAELPADMKLFIVLNKLDTTKINEKRLNITLALVNALDVLVVFALTDLTSNYLIKLIIAIPAALLIITVSYKVFGLWFKK